MEHETLKGLHDILEEWSDRFEGVTRIELRPLNKHTGKQLVPDYACPTLPLELLGPDVREAVEALIFLRVLRGLLHPNGV